MRGPFAFEGWHIYGQVGQCRGRGCRAGRKEGVQMGILDSAKGWLRGWSVNVDHDYRPFRRFGVFNVAMCRLHWCREDYMGAHFALLGLHLSVTKYAGGAE